MTDRDDQTLAERVYCAIEILETVERSAAESVASCRRDVVAAIREAREAGLGVATSFDTSRRLHETEIPRRYDTITISRPIARSAP